MKHTDESLSSGMDIIAANDPDAVEVRLPGMLVTPLFVAIVLLFSAGFFIATSKS